MNSQEFQEVLESQIMRIGEVLGKKAEEYATQDRLHNFKVAASLQDKTQIQALGGMMVKHTVSIYDMIETSNDGVYYPLDIWDEKITDHINYLILLRACVVEGISNIGKE